MNKSRKNKKENKMGSKRNKWGSDQKNWEKTEVRSIMVSIFPRDYEDCWPEKCLSAMAKTEKTFYS